MISPNGGGNRGREDAAEIFRREVLRAQALGGEVEAIYDQGRSWLPSEYLEGTVETGFGGAVERAKDTARLVNVPLVSPAVRALDALGDTVLAAKEFVGGVLEDGSDEMEIDGDGETGGEEETIESLATTFGLTPDQLAFMVLGTTALVPFGPKALAVAGTTALVVPGAKALMAPMIKAIAARTVALAPYTILRVAGGKSMLAMVLRLLLGLLTAKEIYDILSDLFPSIFPPLFDRRGPAVAVYERGNLVAFARGPVTHAPGRRHPGGRYVRKLQKTGPRVEIIT